MSPEAASPLADPSCFARFVVRARRRADLSQRELAARLGVSHTTVSRIETGTVGISAEMFARVLALAGLRLDVVDDTGAVVLPVSHDTVRDNAGRRFPAHLDVGPPDVLTEEQIHRPRYDRMPAKGTYHLRERRDRMRQLAPEARREAVAIGHPDATIDHPTSASLEQRRRLMRGPQPTVRPAPLAEIECDCATGCFEGVCLDDCSCQCEPRQSASLTVRFGRTVS